MFAASQVFLLWVSLRALLEGFFNAPSHLLHFALAVLMSGVCLIILLVAVYPLFSQVSAVYVVMP